MDAIVHNYKRFDGESDDELILRICNDKENIGTWNDVAAVLNSILNCDYTESAYRKKVQYFKKVLDANQSKFADGTAQLKELKEERILLEKERVKTRDERNEYRRLIREEARKESYREQILRSISEYHGQPLDYDKKKQFTGILKADNDLVISVTDIHAGIEIDNWFNKYNTDVMYDRFRQYLDKIFEVYLRHGSENIHVILSEMISGLIHNSLRIESNQNLIEQFLTVSDCISQFLSELSYKFNEVHVYVCPGNHSRLHAKKEESLKGENMDCLAIPFLQAKLQNFKNIEFHENKIDESIAIFSVRGTKVFAVHGDKDDPKTVVQKLSLLTQIRPDIVYMGHRHVNAMSTVYNVKILQSGCISGTDNYCLDNRLQNKPEQLISVINNNGLDCVYDVKFR